MVKRLVSAAILATTALAALSQPRVDTMTGIFDENFRTLQVTVDGDRLADPVIMLNSDDRICFSFDELADDVSYLRYSLIHCNANWQPSGLVDSEFLDGFNYGDVEDYDYSRLTLHNFYHYNICLPNDQMRFTISGNYLLQVYPETDPDNILLQARFMVCEQTASVGADVLSVTDIDYNSRHQQVSVTVDASNATVEDPFNDMMVYISQNGRWDNEVMVRQPLRVMGKTAIYEHLKPLIFPAGNEYRRMEIVNTAYPGMGVEHIDYYDPWYHFTLKTDYPRAYGSYVYDQTQNGRFFIREYNSSRSDLEADYAVVHFSLEMPEMKGTTIFLDGDMVNRRFDPSSMMTYNHSTGAYEKVMLLKQGAYNYQYLAVPADGRSGVASTVEGDFYPTRNEYLVKVYHRRRGERYDRLIGVGKTRYK